ncbi:MAG: SMC-Scp complex subunit ScpB [Phycisphaerales bacterium]|jgi:segregation and condensation protein B|nr:SMC-Scp complex subunit ScpB [Phycisphaerales bacterium]
MSDTEANINDENTPDEVDSTEAIEDIQPAAEADEIEDTDDIAEDQETEADEDIEDAEETEDSQEAQEAEDAEDAEADEDESEVSEEAEDTDSDEESEDTEPREPMTAAEVAATVEAILFSTDTPMTAAKILQVAELSCKRDVTDAVDILNDRYEDSGSAFRIEMIAGGYRLQTLEAYHQVLARLFKSKSESKLSQPAMETLSIVAYRQPVLRADIEAIRGVACGEVLRKLMEKMLIKIVGRAEVIGRPMLYGTTRRFLEVFGLASLSDLPRSEELREAPAPPQKKPPAPEPEGTEESDAEADAEAPQTDQPEEQPTEQPAPIETETPEAPEAPQESDEPEEPAAG